MIADLQDRYAFDALAGIPGAAAALMDECLDRGDPGAYFIIWALVDRERIRQVLIDARESIAN